MSVPFPHHKRLVFEPSKIIHWFGQNGEKMEEGARFTQIPIGLNCQEHALGVDKVREYFKSRYNLNSPLYVSSEREEHESNNFQKDSVIISQKLSVKHVENKFNELDKTLSLDILDPLRDFPILHHEKILLLNFDNNTDGTGSRTKLWDRGCNINHPNSWHDFTDCFKKDPGVKQYIDNLSEIYKRNIQYKFWLSPRGNGIDCHRT